MEVRAKDEYGKRASFNHEGKDYVGTIFGLDRVIKKSDGVSKGTEDIYHIIVKKPIKDELFELKLNSITIL